MKLPPPLVLVVWEDIAVLDDSTWVGNKPYVPKPPWAIFGTVGFLIHIDDDHIVLTSCWGDALIAPRERYPMGCVKSITPLAPAPE